MYRTAAATQKTYETLHRVDVRTARGRWLFAWLAALGITCIIFGAIGGLASRGDRPLDGANWVLGVCIPAAIVLIALSVVVHKRRRRTLRIVRADDGREHRLVVDGTPIDLELPLAVRFGQYVTYAGNVEQYNVVLFLSDAKGSEILLRELRGKLQGPVREGLTEGDTPTVSQRDLEFDVALNVTSDLRRRVQVFNELLTKTR